MTPGIVGESDLSGNLTDEYVFFDGERVARKSTNGVFCYFSDHLKTASGDHPFRGQHQERNPIFHPGGETPVPSTTIQTITSSPAKNAMPKLNSIISGPGITRTGWKGGSAQIGAQRRYLCRTTAWDFHDPQSLNLYGYVRNTPVTKLDADGHCVPFCDIVFHIVEFVAAHAGVTGTDIHARRQGQPEIRRAKGKRGYASTA